MGVAEILLHTHNIARGLGTDWLPPSLLCAGRADMDGLPRRTSWTWQAARPD